MTKVNFLVNSYINKLRKTKNLSKIQVFPISFLLLSAFRGMAVIIAAVAVATAEDIALGYDASIILVLFILLVIIIGTRAFDN